MADPDPSPRTLVYPQWVFVQLEEELYARFFPDSQDALQAARRLDSGEDPATVLGWSARRLMFDRIRSIAWVPDARVLLVHRAWWLDPWRIPFADPLRGEEVFVKLAEELGDGQPPQTRKIGPNDLALDPGFGLGILLAFLGVLTLLLGAIEGVSDAPLQGQARRFRLLAEIGMEIGLWPALGVGAVALLTGIGGLVWWYRHRPTKQVVLARRQSSSSR